MPLISLLADKTTFKVPESLFHGVVPRYFVFQNQTEISASSGILTWVNDRLWIFSSDDSNACHVSLRHTDVSAR